MTISQWGLIANIIGSGLAFFNVMPSKFLDTENAESLSTGSTSPEEKEKRKKNNVCIKTLSITGLILMIIGFILQFVGANR